MAIFLDACVIIYWVELSEPHYSKVISKLEKISHKHPHSKLAISRLSILECCVAPLKSKNKEALKLFEDFFAQPSIQIIELDESVITEATKIRATTSLKTPDAIQAACALQIKSLKAFVTNDKSFSQLKKLPVELI
jgi:predicted nucleic acid-binding protein